VRQRLERLLADQLSAAGAIAPGSAASLSVSSLRSRLHAALTLQDGDGPVIGLHRQFA
jgi:hypothetical protein